MRMGIASNYAWQPTILLATVAGISADADCHAFFLSLGTLAGEPSASRALITTNLNRTAVTRPVCPTQEPLGHPW